MSASRTALPADAVDGQRRAWPGNPVGALAHGLLHRALLRGLRPPRLPHQPSMAALAAALDLPGVRITPMAVHGPRGQRLAAWLVQPPPARADGATPAPLAIGVHGWGANASTLWPMVRPLVGAGIAVALFDAANHGDSGREPFSSLPRFADDLAAVRAALADRPGLDAQRIVLLGHSVGAGAVLLHAERRGGVRAVISLSAFAHPREVMERWLAEHRIPRRWPGHAILEHVQHTIGERFDHFGPLNIAPRVGCPVLLVHGRGDTTVPATDAQRLQAALPRAELLMVDGDHDLRPALAPHAGALLRFVMANL